MRCLACGLSDEGESPEQREVRLRGTNPPKTKGCRRCRRADEPDNATVRTEAELDGRGQAKQPSHAAILQWLRMKGMEHWRDIRGPARRHTAAQVMSRFGVTEPFAEALIAADTVLDLSPETIAKFMVAVRTDVAAWLVRTEKTVANLLTLRDFAKIREQGVTALEEFTDADIAYTCKLMRLGVKL